MTVYMVERNLKGIPMSDLAAAQKGNVGFAGLIVGSIAQNLHHNVGCAKHLGAVAKVAELIEEGQGEIARDGEKVAEPDL